MIKKQYKLFFIGFFLVLAAAALICMKVGISYDIPKVSSYEFVLNETEETGIGEVPLLFSFESGKSVLNCSPAVCGSLNQVKFRYPFGESGQMGLNEFSYQDSMNGTVLVQGQSEDGSVQVCAKSQTLITQGYAAYAYDTHTFGDAAIPVEISYAGSSSGSTDLQVTVFGVPYTGEAVLKTKRGSEATINVKEGVLTGLSILDLRTGIAVSVKDPEAGALLIGTYVVEDYPVFAYGGLRALSNNLILIILVIAGCLMITRGRTVIRKRKENKASVSWQLQGLESLRRIN